MSIENTSKDYFITVHNPCMPGLRSATEYILSIQPSLLKLYVYIVECWGFLSAWDFDRWLLQDGGCGHSGILG